MKGSKLLINFSFDYNDRTFEVFEWKAGYIFKCETKKWSLLKHKKKGFKQNLFCIM